MKARNRVISAAHLITCSIKKRVKAPDLTCMALYGNVLSKVAWTVTQHWVLKKTSRAFTAYYDIPAFVLKKRKTKNQSWPNNVQRGWRGSRNNKQQMQAIVSQCQFKYPIRRSCFSLLFEFDWDLLHTSLVGREPFPLWDGGFACLLAFWAGTSELGKAGTLLIGLIASGVETVVALALVAFVYLLR